MAARAVSPNALVFAVLSAAAMLGVLAGVDPRVAAAVAVGLIFVALVFNDVALGLYFLAFTAFLEALPTFGSFSLAKLVGLLLAASWVAVVADRNDARTLSRARPLLITLIFGFLAWAVLSITWAEDQSAAITAVTRYTPNLLLFPIVFTAVRTPNHAMRVLAVIVGAAAFAASFGIVSSPPDPGATRDAARATSTVGDANELAASLVVGLIIASSFILNRAYSSLARLASTLAAMLCLAGIMLTVSRGGLIALAASLAVAVVFSGRWRPRVVALALVTIVCAGFYITVLAPSAARERLLGQEHGVSGGTGRLDLWTIAGRMVYAHPLDGVGVGQFPISSIHYLLEPGLIQRDDFVISAKPKVAHNTYLQVTAETGFVGVTMFTAIVLFALSCIALAARSFARQGDERLEILSRGLFIALMGYLTAMIFLTLMYSKLLWILLALGPPLLAIAKARESAENAGDELTDDGVLVRAAPPPAARRRAPEVARP